MGDLLQPWHLVVLGVVEHAVPFVGYEALQEGMRGHLPSRLLEANLRALAAGMQAGPITWPSTWPTSSTPNP